jgi:menaquinone-dependent protoporphyrinogen oxidase
MPNPILVAYGTRHGATAEVAQVVGEVLAVGGADVAVHPLADVQTLEGYPAAVIGAPLYSAAWLPEATGFVKTHQAALARMRVACFVLAIRLRLPDEGLRQAVLSAIATERVMMKPLSVGLFAGALDYARLSPIVRLQAQTKGLPEGDFRDWDAIRAWAAEVGPLLAR